MTWPAHWLFRVEGEFRVSGTTVLETFSNGIRFLPAGGDPFDPQEWLETVAVPAVETFYSQNFLSSSVWVTQAKMNAIDPDGRYADNETTNVYFWPGGDEPRGLNSSSVEPQRALAVSWITAAMRGRASKGRIFLPGFAVPVQPDLLISAVAAQDVEAAAESYINALNAGEPQASVVSGVGAGTGRLITGVRVGRAVDTIRRRRRSLNESWVNIVP